MFAAPIRREIDHRTMKLLVGLIALSLANLTSILAGSSITSISASYYAGGWAQSVFIGFLFAIAAFLVAYNGFSTTEMVLSKVAAIAALGVAMFPCKCDNHSELVPGVHGVSSGTMFLILAYFCYLFYRRALNKGHAQALARASIYAVSGGAIIVSILTVALDHILKGKLSLQVPRLTFYAERTGLMAFGISWLTASRVLPVLTRGDERFSPFSDSLVDTASSELEGVGATWPVGSPTVEVQEPALDRRA